MTKKSNSRILRDARFENAKPGLDGALKDLRNDLSHCVDDINVLLERTDIPMADVKKLGTIGFSVFEFRKWVAKYEQDIIAEKVVTLT